MKEKPQIIPIAEPEKYKKYSVISESVQKMKEKGRPVSEDLERAMHNAFGITLKSLRGKLL